MFLFHFFGDLDMPLHVEDYEKGGNKILVCFDGHKDNLHSIWDTDMAHKINGIKHRLKHNDKKVAPLKWAKHLLQKNKHRPMTAVECADVINTRTCVKQLAEETNRLNCAVVFKRWLPYLNGEDLAGDTMTMPCRSLRNKSLKQVCVRLATWINAIAEKSRAKTAFVVQGDRMRDL
ncbi:S1/P1 nuclease [Penicillium canescens]|uniref:S1/P1 nuclease n=2 Tax=Penicillium canescens TaxID=5083 RepID=A0AAD6NBP4_PENCN|nr:S1/P1 nuclease [Penicillium canescens]KAJ6047313.1 S1/P1 nuclease [Penicillium canescens]